MIDDQCVLTSGTPMTIAMVTFIHETHVTDVTDVRLDVRPGPGQLADLVKGELESAASQGTIPQLGSDPFSGSRAGQLRSKSSD